MLRTLSGPVLVAILALAGCRPGAAPRPRDAGRPRAVMGPVTPGPALPREPTIAVGAAAVGELTPQDVALPDGPVSDSYIVELTADQRVTIVARGGPSNSTPGALLDVSCEVLQGARVLTTDDDGASTPDGAHNCRILFQARAPGRYTVRVRTPGTRRELGPYNVQVYAGWLPTQT